MYLERILWLVWNSSQFNRHIQSVEDFTAARKIMLLHDYRAIAYRFDGSRNESSYSPYFINILVDWKVWLIGLVYDLCACFQCVSWILVAHTPGHELWSIFSYDVSFRSSNINDEKKTTSCCCYFMYFSGNPGGNIFQWFLDFLPNNSNIFPRHLLSSIFVR